MEAVHAKPVVEELRQRIAALSTATRASDALPFGIQEFDDRLAGRGLSGSALHELTQASPTLADDAATTLFAAGIAARFALERPVLWVLTRFDLYSPGIEQAGLPPERTLFAEVRDDREVLAVMEDGLRHGSLAAVVGEARRADMTATRRLQLAAAEGRTPALLFRRWRKAGAPPLAAPSSAMTRWAIACAPSRPLGVPGVGRPRWLVSLARQRNGDPFTLTVEGCDAQGRLGVPAAAADRAPAAGAPAARAA